MPVVASHTVTYVGDEPAAAFVIADLDDGGRWIGRTEDAELIAAALDADEPFIGRRVRVDGNAVRPG